MKRICPTCERNRKFGKYYNNKSRISGKQVECKDCQTIRNKQDRQTIRYKIFKRKRDKKWKENNRDKVKRYNADYYRSNKERIMSRRNTESILIVENGSKKKINRSRHHIKKHTDDIVIDPKRR